MLYYIFFMLFALLSSKKSFPELSFSNLHVAIKFIKVYTPSQARWHMLVILALGNQRQEVHDSEDSLS